MTQSEKQKWERIRLKGWKHFILVYGVLRIGILSGIVFSVLPYEIGLVTHAYTMSVWWLGTLAVSLALAFGFGFGALIWHLNQKIYQNPDDDHVPGLQKFDKSEFLKMVGKIGRRHYFRLLFVALVVLIVLIGTLSIIPHSSSHRNYYMWSLIIFTYILGFLGIRFLIRATKADCYKFGALCPKCGKPLYSRFNDIQKGRCPNCGYQLFSDSHGG